MAVIYRATDLARQREVALKQLIIHPQRKHYAAAAALFEREFHTLSELSHPRVIEVYDYGLDEHGPFYTMELLDGGDLHARSPWPWQQACTLIFDVCSSLALIHSRRLVHRDISPANVRYRRDGHAKLIDFGAMAPMGRPSGLHAGTPSFVAPEVVLRAVLDARTDLFSLGATLYYALTGRAPYTAKDFASLTAAWTVTPPPPSQLAPDVPPALDALVLALIALEPAQRLRSAFEVMQRVAAIAGIERAEPVSVTRSYLATPVLVGREPTLEAIREQMSLAFAGRGSALLIEGAAGVGRSRMIDACALLAKTLGATVLRASGALEATSGFGAVSTLAEQLAAYAPRPASAHAHEAGAFETLFETSATATSDGEPVLELKALNASASTRLPLQRALTDWLLSFAQELPLVIAIDDLQRIDEPSAALLAGLASRVQQQRLIIIASVESGAAPSDQLALTVLTRHAQRHKLLPLERADVERLFESVFGDVPNVAIVSHGIDAIAAGNPRTCLELAQHLVDGGVLRYEGGSWTLPSRLEGNALPSSAEEAIRARIAGLEPLARWLAQAQALATYPRFGCEDYAKLRPDMTRQELERALDQLVSAQVLVSDGLVYTLTHAGYATALEQPLSDDERCARHRALMTAYEGRPGLGVVRHALLGGLPHRALDALAPLLGANPEASALYESAELSPEETAATIARALSAAEHNGRSLREINELRRWLSAFSVISDDAHYQRAAPAWLEQLKHDAGYFIYQQHTDLPAQERLSRTMQLAFERYAATPESERVYRPDEAVRGLAHFVGISIAIASSRVEPEITESLPELLAPFAPLSPMIDALLQNTIAAREMSCRAQLERARTRWLAVYTRLGELEGAEPQFLGVFRRAIAAGLGALEASIGIAGADNWADFLDEDPAQRVTGLYLRRLVRLQQGDLDGAEHFRRRAELLSLQVRARQMFNNLILSEANACTLGNDLTGLKQCLERVRAQAQRSPGWIPGVLLVEGHLQLLSDNHEAALHSYERGLARVLPALEQPYPLRGTYCPLAAGCVDALNALGRHTKARAAGLEALAICKQLEIEIAAVPIARGVALAEARLGEHGGAAARLEAAIALQLSLGVSGLHLGASYEARARVAIMAADEAALALYATLTAREYRHGRGSPLGARYERLMREARNAREVELPSLAALDASHVSNANDATRVLADGVVEQAEAKTELIDPRGKP